MSCQATQAIAAASTGRHVFHPVDDGEPVGQPLVLVPVEVADQRPAEAVKGAIFGAFDPCPAGSTTRPFAARGVKLSSASSRLERASSASISASSSARASS
jgi:hypothetical protein